MNDEERYLATKQALQTLSGDELKKRLCEIYTPDVIAEMAAQEKLYLSPERKEQIRRELNRQTAKQRRDKTREKDYGARSTRKP